MMKMQAYDVQGQTRQENVLPSVEMAITSKREKGNVTHAPQAVSPAKIHRTLARAASLRNFFEKKVCLKSDNILAKRHYRIRVSVDLIGHFTKRHLSTTTTIHFFPALLSLVLICRRATCDIVAGATCDTVPI